MTLPDRTTTSANLITPAGGWFIGGGRAYPQNAEGRATAEALYNRQLVPLLRARREAGVQGGVARLRHRERRRGRSRPRVAWRARRHAGDRQGVGPGPQPVVHRPWLRVVRSAPTSSCSATTATSAVCGCRSPSARSSTGRPTRCSRARSTRSRSTLRSIPRMFQPAPRAASNETSLVAALALALTLARSRRMPALAWPQWGGPNRNFVTGAADLAASWPAAGPRRIWARPLGDGFSSIVTDGSDSLHALSRRSRRRGGGAGCEDGRDALGDEVRRAIQGDVQRAAGAGAARRAARSPAIG